MNKKIILPDEKIKKPTNIEGIYLIKNYISNKNITIGDYTYYHCDNEQEAIEFQNKNIRYHFPNFFNDNLVIGKFCSIAKETIFLMNGANHNYNAISSYPFYLYANDEEFKQQMLTQLPNRGDTVIGNDVWIGYQATIMPGIKIGNGAVIGTKSVVTKNVPPYAIVAGNPAKIIKYRFDQSKIIELEKMQWWNWTKEEIINKIDLICLNNSF
ncbi:acetyltransferase [Spiroplasma syrphidicola EA-1]|uniref:Acetyltransferase n=1 Tax=Spiroplasma syrphidicola EA-1 TaxID=1276229 RepID=R4U3T8_9MOLU|nr:CatB-related O-acetyltransferase [Spiroplasma syrphidicola]AGM26092.1 acetyltransferase [Spiroplasma syrphidicola EA-1]